MNSNFTGKFADAANGGKTGTTTALRTGGDLRRFKFVKKALNSIDRPFKPVILKPSTHISNTINVQVL